MNQTVYEFVKSLHAGQTFVVTNVSIDKLNEELRRQGTRLFVASNNPELKIIDKGINSHGQHIAYVAQKVTKYE